MENGDILGQRKTKTSFHSQMYLAQGSSPNRKEVIRELGNSERKNITTG